MFDFSFNHQPTPKEIERVTDTHEKLFTDYVRVWFDNGTSRVYSNTMPVVCYITEEKWEVRFFAPELLPIGAFGKLGIIRAKRVLNHR